jgi:hypothetical protein
MRPAERTPLLTDADEKSLFARAIENSPDRRREFRVKMWGTSSPDDKLTGDLASVIEAISIDDRGSDCLAAGKLAPGNLGLFQQHRPNSEAACASQQLTPTVIRLARPRE